jgi:hypothetical protein
LSASRRSNAAKQGVIRQLPPPQDVLSELDREFSLCDAQRDPDRANKRIWTWSRTTAGRRVKEIMAAAVIRPTSRQISLLLISKAKSRDSDFARFADDRSIFRLVHHAVHSPPG